MLRKILTGRTFSCMKNVCRGSYARRFSSDTPTEEPTIPEDSKTLSRLLNESANYSDAQNKDWGTSPYPEGAAIDPQMLRSRPEKVDPKQTSVLIFPGQGIIRVGQVKKYLQFPNVKDIFEIASEILGYNVLKICLDGPQEKLNLTKYNQTATVVASLAALERLREERPIVFETCVAAAGYSVGELTALIFAGVLSLEDGIRLVHERATAMQYASDLQPQGMLSVLCNSKSQLLEACKDAKQLAKTLGIENPVCDVAIYLYTEAKIIAGHRPALDYVKEQAQKYHLSKVQDLPVSGAFHTALMDPALQRFKKALYNVAIEEPRCIVYSNYTSKPCLSLNKIKAFLLKQITHPIKWEQIMQQMFSRPLGETHPKIFDVCSHGRMKAILNSINVKAANSCIAV